MRRRPIGGGKEIRKEPTKPSQGRIFKIGDCTCKGPEEWKLVGQGTERRSVEQDHNGLRGEKSVRSLEKFSGTIDLPGS